MRAHIFVPKNLEKGLYTLKTRDSGGVVAILKPTKRYEEADCDDPLLAEELARGLANNTSGGNDHGGDVSPPRTTDNGSQKKTKKPCSWGVGRQVSKEALENRVSRAKRRIATAMIFYTDRASLIPDPNCENAAG